MVLIFQWRMRSLLPRTRLMSILGPIGTVVVGSGFDTWSQGIGVARLGDTPPPDPRPPAAIANSLKWVQSVCWDRVGD